MRTLNLSDEKQYIKGEMFRRRWHASLMALSALVLIITVYVFMLPAITMEKNCGLEEHTHNEDCYGMTEMNVPVCTVEALEIHEHTEECYDDEGELICGYADFILHTHDENCYDEEGNFWCELSEIEEHEHDEECYEEVPLHMHSSDCYTTEQGDLICEDESEEHEHDEDCYEKNRVFTCEEDDTLTETVIACEEDEIIYHEHDEEECYDEDGNLICDKIVVRSHQHTAACFELREVEKAVCGHEEHVHTAECSKKADADSDSGDTDTDKDTAIEYICGKDVHTHDEMCFDAEGNVICALEEHAHDETCVATDNSADNDNNDQQPSELPTEQPQYVCGLEEHAHAETCLDEEGNVICGLEEHAHDETCTAAEKTALSEEDQARVDNVIALIDELPTNEELSEQFETIFENIGDDENGMSYYAELYMKVKTAYIYFEDLGPELQEYVTNGSKLMELSWIWDAETLEVKNTLTVYQVNKYSMDGTTLVYGGSVSEKFNGGMTFTYWDVIVVEKNDNGKLYVDKYIKEDKSKLDYKATTSDGFVLLLYNTSVNVAVGDEVNVSFDYKAITTGYNADGYGKIAFGSTKPEKDNSEKLTINQNAADTRDLIEVNLYDYGTNINDLYKNKAYPGFQQDNGTKSVNQSKDNSSIMDKYSFNFGNNITSDLAAGNSNVTNQGGSINATMNSANSPISDAMQTTLGNDGYPALADGLSLSYLFSDGTYATKKNSESINGLFLYNNDTGAYTFNSRENHAQFNPGTDTFTLYDQIITSNFMMYPFGNFLPFNDIVHQSAQASTINKEYLESIATSASYKYNNDAGGEYNTLATQLGKFVSLMDDAYSEGWTAADCATEYFKSAEIGKTFTNTELSNIYSIDYDEPTDFYFGMEMKMNFMQPKGGLTGTDGNQPMKFYFTGDDDVWVYVDGKLFLDLSGIHRHVGGEIDFVNGVVKYYSLDVSTGDVSTTPYKTVKFEELIDDEDLVNVGDGSENKRFKDYSKHTFNFYYIERGAGSGVCRMNFNFPLLKKNAISVTKELSVDSGDESKLLGDPDFKFQIIESDSSDLFETHYTDLNGKEIKATGAGVTYKICDSAGQKIGEGTTDNEGIFKIKAGQTAVFENIPENAGSYRVRELLDSSIVGQYGQIKVDGTVVTNYDITVGSESFTGVTSPPKSISDGNSIFSFNNQVTYSGLGKLSIEKILNAYEGYESGEKTFDFEVTLDGKPVPEGTEYKVVKKDESGQESEIRVGKVKRIEGSSSAETINVITLAPGEKAVISNILAGTKFTVNETEASSKGCIVSYKLNVEAWSSANGSVSGTIEVSSEVEVSVTNTIEDYELPNTGGAGTTPYTTGGILLITTSLLLLCYKTKCRHRRSASK